MSGNLIEAVLGESIEEVTRELDAGTDVNERDRAGRTALIHAAVDGLEEIVRVLLVRSADPRAYDVRGWTALHFAVQDRHLAVVRLLLEAGADPNAQDANGNSPVFRAVFAVDGSVEAEEVVCTLARAGGRFDVENHHGVSARTLATSVGMDLDALLRRR